MSVRRAQQAGTGLAAAASTVLTEAHFAWCRADFAACVSVLEPMALCTGDTPDQAEAVLLYGRTLLRLKQPLRAQQFLKPRIGTFCSVDTECTARMLYAAATTSCETPDAGLSLLQKVAEDADCLGADRAVRSEIALHRAVGHWAKRELGIAAKYACAAEDAQLDVLAVRATQLRGFIALAERRYVDALHIFRTALIAYRSCGERDADLVEQILVQIATLETQLRSSIVTGSYRNASARTVPGDVFRSSASLGRCQVKSMDAWQHAHDGDLRSALRCIREAESFAPAPPWKVFALAGRASISAAFGETENAREHALHAAGIAEGLDWQATRGEERFALILLAEAFGSLDPAEGAKLLARFDAITSAIDRVQFACTDPRKAALESYVRGLIARGLGQRPRARALLHDAYRDYQACGHRWRTALTLIELDATAVPATVHEACHLETATLIVREHFPRSFLARRLGRWGNVYDDPVAARLTPAQRQVLRYALDGYGAKEIASVTGRSVKTVGNQLAALHEAFGVNSTLRLVADCHRRGLGSPAWRNPNAPAAVRRDTSAAG